MEAPRRGCLGARTRPVGCRDCARALRKGGSRGRKALVVAGFGCDVAVAQPTGGAAGTRATSEPHLHRGSRRRAANRRSFVRNELARLWAEAVSVVAATACLHRGDNCRGVDADGRSRRVWPASALRQACSGSRSAGRGVDPPVGTTGKPRPFSRWLLQRASTAETIAGTPRPSCRCVPESP